MLDLFLEIHLNEIDDLTFDHHCQSIGQSQLELIATGRWGGVIVDRAIVDPLRELIPLVRTTTMYTSPVMLFNQLYRKMVEEISKSLDRMRLIAISKNSKRQSKRQRLEWPQIL